MLNNQCFTALLALLLFFCQASPAQSDEDKTTTKLTLTVPATSAKILVDGELDEEAWNAAQIVSLDYEIRPGENVAPPVRTEMLITYDANFVYFGFRAFDPDVSAIRAHLNDRDSAWSDDWVGVVLDTFNDERRSLNFQCNPLGVQMDSIEWDGGDDHGWDAIWHSAGKVTDWGYAVEMAIPFSSLRFQRSNDVQTWGIHAERNYPRNHVYRFSLAPVDRDNNCYLCQAYKLVGFAGATPGNNLEITPTVTTIRTDERSEMPKGKFEPREESAEAGITARWGITPNMTVAGTLNPDFSQVEADSLQLDINSPFALYYHEKRPFFTEGSDFFNTRIDAFYTRTLRDPVWGAKISGKEGPHTIGAYLVRDDLTNLIFPGSQRSRSTSLAMESTAAVFRYKYDLGSKHTFGAMITDREGDDYYNRVASFDGVFRFTSNDIVKVQVLGSSTKYPGDVARDFNQNLDGFSDLAYEARIDHDTRNVHLLAGYRDIGEDFRADLGFIPQVDYKTFYGGGGYTWHGDDKSWFSSISVSSLYQQFHDHNGDLIQRYYYIQGTYEGPLQSHAMSQFTSTRQAYNGLEFDLKNLRLHNCMTVLGTMHWGVTLDIGQDIDHDNSDLQVQTSEYIIH